MTHFLIAGASGMLGTALQGVLSRREDSFTAPSECDFDITDPRVATEVVERFVADLPGHDQGILINAAAYTNVERAEDEPEVAYRVNRDGPSILAEAAQRVGIGFVHISTDFVFDGTKPGPYVEGDEPNPLSAYGASKLAGERAVLGVDPRALIVRTAWAFGPGGQNFPRKILDLALDRDELSVVTDEVGSPTYTVDLADGILDLVEAGAGGLFHLTNAGSCTRFDLATHVLQLVGLERTLVPVTADSFPSKAARPANSVLDCTKAAALGVVLPGWEDALGRFVSHDVQER